MQPASGVVAAEPAVSTSPRRSPLVIALAVSTAVSGVLTLYSLIQSPVSSRLARLYEIFPLEFVNLSRFMTLVLGFALVLSSLNLFRRKRRAYHAVIVLACLSIVFHLTKGVDYEHALLSLLLILLLVAGRRHFTVRSGRPVLRPALLGVGAALAVGIGYGVLGFWLLDPREFGIDFTMGEAVRQTLRGLSLAGDPRLVPHTRHAAWFLDSLPLMSATVVVYALTLLFRPVLYRLRVAPQERTAAGEIVHQHGRSSLDFFKLWPDKSRFFPLSKRAFLAYSVAGGFALVPGRPCRPRRRDRIDGSRVRGHVRRERLGLRLL